MLPHIGKIFLTGFSANVFRYRDVKIRSCMQVFQTSYYTVYKYIYLYIITMQAVDKAARKPVGTVKY